MPHKVWIVMGQGACADLAYVSFCSGTFYTCSGIAMVNSTIGRGGLYHYPAMALTDPDEAQYKETEAVLKQMLGYIRPDAVNIVTAVDSTGAGQMGTPQRDKNAMVNWFQQIGFPATLAAEATWAGLSSGGVSTRSSSVNWPDGELHDWQGRSAGVYPLGGTNVTLLGKSGESQPVEAMG